MRWQRTIRTKELDEQWRREGRGQGEWQNYAPWLRAEDITNRITAVAPGLLVDRPYHLLSPLQANYFRQLEWEAITSGSVVDIREQFPLKWAEDTLELAAYLQMSHPVDGWSKEPVVMVTTFLVTKIGERGAEYTAIAVRSNDQMNRANTQRYLMLEQAYWHNRGVKWSLVTSRDVNMTLVRNLYLIGPGRHRTGETYAEMLRIAERVKAPLLKGNASILEVCNANDRRMRYDPGTSMGAVMGMLGANRWVTDLEERPLDVDEPLRFWDNPSPPECLNNLR